MHIRCGGLSQGAVEPLSHSLPLQWDGRENHKGKRVETDGGTKSFTGKAKAAGAQPSQTVTAAQHRQVLSIPRRARSIPGGRDWDDRHSIPFLPPSPVLHAEHGAAQSGTSLGHWGLSCVPSQRPVPPSPMLAMGTEQSYALCRPSPAQLNPGVLSALLWAQIPAQLLQKISSRSAKCTAFKNFLRAFYFF